MAIMLIPSDAVPPVSPNLGASSVLAKTSTTGHPGVGGEQMNPPAHKTRALSDTAWRTTPLPLGWHKTRQQVFTRDGHQCTFLNHDGQRCTAMATEVHHIGDPEDHSLDNLAAACTPHHASETARAANAIRWARARARQQAPRQHPGLLPPGG